MLSLQKRDKLKDVQFSLKDKHSRNALIKFFEDQMMNVRLVNNKLMTEFKTKSIGVKQSANVELSEGLTKLSDEMNKVERKYKSLKNLAKEIQKNQVEMQKYRSAIQELEKFNTKLETEIANK